MPVSLGLGSRRRCANGPLIIGCLLTNQLPFQTWVATYFCFVDICLVGQYVYYSRPKFRRHLTILPTISRPQSRLRSYSDVAQSTASVRRSASQISRHVPRLRRISTIAANVAAAASELDNRLVAAAASVGGDRTVAHDSQGGSEANDEVGGLLTESWHSDDSPRAHRRNVSWGPDPDPTARQTRFHSQQRHAQVASTSSLMHLPPTDLTPETEHSNPNEVITDLERGRPLTRPIYDSPVDLVSHDASVPNPESLYTSEGTIMRSSSAASGGILGSILPTASRRKSASASRRGAGIVFLSVWALFGFSGKLGMHSGGSGVVLNSQEPSLPWSVASSSHFRPSIPTSTLLPLVTFPYPLRKDGDSEHDDEYTPPPPPPPPVSMEHVIGRISAWACTTLYLTSRLPQIWKNVSFRQLVRSSRSISSSFLVV